MLIELAQVRATSMSCRSYAVCRGDTSRTMASAVADVEAPGTAALLLPGSIGACSRRPASREYCVSK